MKRKKHKICKFKFINIQKNHFLNAYKKIKIQDVYNYVSNTNIDLIKKFIIYNFLGYEINQSTLWYFSLIISAALLSHGPFKLHELI